MFWLGYITDVISWNFLMTHVFWYMTWFIYYIISYWWFILRHCISGQITDGVGLQHFLLMTHNRYCTTFMCMVQSQEAICRQVHIKYLYHLAMNIQLTIQSQSLFGSRANMLFHTKLLKFPNWWLNVQTPLTDSSASYHGHTIVANILMF